MTCCDICDRTGRLSAGLHPNTARHREIYAACKSSKLDVFLCSFSVFQTH